MHLHKNISTIYLLWSYCIEKLFCCYTGKVSDRYVVGMGRFKGGSKSVCTVSFFYKKLRSSLVPLFKERGAAVCFPRFGTHRCRGTEANEFVGFAVGYDR